MIQQDTQGQGANGPRTFWLQSGPPRQGKESGLAGVAEPGDFVMVTGYGCYINRGTRAEPRWEPYTPVEQTFFIR